MPVLFYLIIAIILIFSFVIFYHYSFAIWLRENHHEKWKEVGAPFNNNGSLMNFVLLGFSWMPLSKTHYDHIDDPELNKLREWALVASWCGGVLIFTLVILYALGSYLFY